MEVILRENVENLGKVGDVVKVKDGYARNYLLPQRLAYVATESNKRRIGREAEAIAARQATDKNKAEEFAARLAEVTLTFSVKVGEEDKLYGSVTSADIQEQLAQQGFEVEKRRIALPEPIRALGEFAVSLRLHPEVKPELQVTVVKEEE